MAGRPYYRCEEGHTSAFVFGALTAPRPRAIFYPMTDDTTVAARSRGEAAFYLVLGALTLLAASVPYLVGWLRTPPGHTFSGITYNIDDTAVYLSWMDQASRGHFFQRNQFTTEPQKGVLFNLFFLLLGNLARFTGLSLIVVYHAARVVCGGLLLWAFAALLRAALADTRARRLAYALACVSAGLGWLWGGYAPERGYQQPADLWQPEAITFLSLYYTGLFTAALSLMAVFIGSALRVERSGRVKDAWPAAVAGALLGNFHSYDVIPLFAVWIAYRAFSDALTRRINLPRWGGLVMAGLATLPTTAYQYWAIRSEKVFYERALVSSTPSPEPWWFVLGFGLVAVFAVVAATAVPTARTRFADAPAFRLFVVWAVVGLAVAYFPITFQRKLLMGEHLPLCVLAGAAIAALTARLPGSFPGSAAFLAVALSAVSNLLWLQRDIDRLDANVGSTARRPYLTTNEMAALRWLREHARTEDAVLVSPDATAHLRFPGTALEPFLSVYVPAYAGCVVFNGHWSETTRFERKFGEVVRFFRAETDDSYREALLRDNGIRYVLFDNRLAEGPLRAPSGEVIPLPDRPYTPVSWPVQPTSVPPYLSVAYQNSDVTVYAVSGADDRRP
jgi:hypothetical protein